MLDEFGAPIFTPEEEEHIKRTEQMDRPRWPAVNKPKDTSGPEPARIVSDIDDDKVPKTSAARLSAMLANNPKIQAAQSEWEKKNQPQSRPSSTGSGVSTLRPPRKRESPSSYSAVPVAKRQNSEFDRTQAREEALRFTEEEVSRQMSELSDTAIKRSSGTSRGHAQMHFATGNELLKKYTVQTTSPTPAQTGPTKPPATVPAKPPIVGDRIVAITIAEGDRLYSSYPLPEGGTTSARGAIIPPKYKLHDDPALPFVCPVRDCRRLFKGLQGLGGHFGAGHCSTTFNDNGDGTLSKVGSYQKNGPGGTPGIVVSRNPLPPNAPPPVDPGLSVFASFQQNRVSRAEQLAKKPTRSQETPVFPPVPLVRSSTDSDVKSFLHKHLSPDQTEYHRADIDFMLALPRKRDLTEGWKHGHSGKTVDINHYACALAYLTGTVVTGSAQCTANTARPTARLSTPCIALPPGMPPWAKQAFSTLESCVGCRYWCHLQRRSNACDWCPHPIPRHRPSAGSARSSSSEDITPTMEIDEEEESEEPISGTVTETVHETKRPKRRSTVHMSANTGEQPTVGTSTGQMGDIKLEMEDWEIAPGRIMDDSSSDNIAFSNSYLTSGRPVTVSEDISFNVIVIKPGTVRHWNVEDDKLRTCSVVAGKVRITMGKQTFQMGPNGMFVVRPGQACKVENLLYIDAAIHCTTIGDFALQ